MINVTGLGLGIACSLLMMLWVMDEISYDKFHENSDNLYLVLKNRLYDTGEIRTSRATMGPLAEGLEREIPEIERAVPVYGSEDYFFVDDQKFKEAGIYTNSEFLEVFSFPLVEGDPRETLESPNSIIISQTLAQKYFNSQSAIGKNIKMNNGKNFQVTGIVKDVPSNSSLQFDYMVPIESFTDRNAWAKEWGNNYLQTYIQLGKNASLEDVNSKLATYLEAKNPRMKVLELFLQPFDTTYLNSKYDQGELSGGRRDYVALFSIVALFVLLLGCINFVNLSSANAARRIKEIGVSKAIGASRYTIVHQFFGEALTITLFSTLVAILLTVILLPFLNTITQKSLAIPFLDLKFILLVFGLVIFTATVSGGYSALRLSAVNTVSALNDKIKASKRSIYARKAMVVFQFVLTTVLIVGMIVVNQQIHFIKNKNLGMDRDNIIYMSLDGDLRKNYEVFKQEAQEIPGITSVTASSQNPLMVGSSSTAVDWTGKSPDQSPSFQMIRTDYDFLETMAVKLDEGRDFSKAMSTDTMNYLINEEAARVMGLSNPIGERIDVWEKRGQIIGMMGDFHLNSLHNPIEPLIVWVEPKEANYFLARFDPNRLENVLEGLGRLSRRHNPAFPFEYRFLDQDFEQMYRTEAVVGLLANSFTVFAIIISCLGLFGLSLFTVNQRTKEIGIRKVLGASVAGVVAMLFKDFLKPVLLALLIASPFAWYFMGQWLETFTYHISVQWWVFALAGVLVGGIAFLTVSFQSTKAALANPVKSLRTE